MKDTILRDLYFGEHLPWERGRVQSAEYDRLIREIGEIDAHFRTLLSDEEYRKMEEMEDLRAQAKLIEDVDLFEYAFSAGVRVMNAAFSLRET